jgi:formylglycine-generating enzyme required for sulfatase activity
MKKFWVLYFVLLCIQVFGADLEVTCGSANYTRGYPGIVVDIPVSLANQIDITGIQFDVTLPDVAVMSMDNGEPDVWLSDRKTRTHSLQVSKINNTYRVLVTSSTNRAFSGNEGPLVHMNISIPQQTNVSNSYDMTISNIVLTEPDETQHRLNTVYGKIQIGYVVGDANGNATVELDDRELTVDYIFGRNPSRFYSDAANVNNTGGITVADVVGISNYVMGINPPQIRPIPMMTKNVESGTFILSCDLQKISQSRGMPERVIDIPILMNNSRPVTGIQFDYYIPVILNVEQPSFQMNESRFTGDIIMEREGNDYEGKVLISSVQNKTLKGNSGSITSIRVRVPKMQRTQSSSISITSAEIVEPDETAHSCSFRIPVDFNYIVGDADGDAAVDVADYIKVANKILERNNSIFYSDAADVNNDGIITVVDLVGVANIAIGVRPITTRHAPSLFEMSSGNLINLFGRIDSNHNLILGVSNDVPIAAMQFDIKLPNGLKIERSELKGLSDKFHVQYAELCNGYTRVLISSYSDCEIESDYGDFLCLMMCGEPEAGGQFEICNIVMSEQNLTTHKAEPLSLAVETSSLSSNTFMVNGVSFTMIPIQGGTFSMGATSEQSNYADSSEKPVHQVTLSDFSIGETEVTQALWVSVMGTNPSHFIGDLQRPVDNVSWEMCQEFITKLNEISGSMFRLPTEAEWEYAARGGNMSRGYRYSGSNLIGSVAWYDGNAGSGVQYNGPDYGTHPVATKAPNELGLYDMSGNVSEWCQDWYGAYGSASQENPLGPESGTYRVTRGGSYTLSDEMCRVSTRRYSLPSNCYGGLRLVWQEKVVPEYYLSADTLHYVRGTTDASVVLPICLNNENEISGLQFDITLPSGISMAMLDGYPDVWLDSSRKSRNHSVEVESQGGSSSSGYKWRVLVSSPTGQALKGNSGALVYINLKVPQYSSSSGLYTIKYANVIMTSPDETEYHQDDWQSRLSYEYLIGDANADVTVDVADYVVAASKVLNRTPQGRFFQDAADVNQSGGVNVTDLIGITNIALGRRAGGVRRIQCVDGFTQPVLQGHSISDGDNGISLELCNDMLIAGLQFDLI